MSERKKTLSVGREYFINSNMFHLIGCLRVNSTIRRDSAGSGHIVRNIQMLDIAIKAGLR